MSAVDPFLPETWPVAQQSARAAAVRAAVIADPSQAYGYAVLAEGQVTVKTFPDAESLSRALAAIFTRGSEWQYPLSWESVLLFEPEQPGGYYLVPEYTDADFASRKRDKS